MWRHLTLILIIAMTLVSLPGTVRAEGIPEVGGVAALKRVQTTLDSDAPGYAQITMVESSFDLSVTINDREPGRRYTWDVRVGDYCEEMGQGTSALDSQPRFVVANQRGVVRINAHVVPLLHINEDGTQGIAVRIRAADVFAPLDNGCGRIWGLPPGSGGSRHWW